MGQVHLKKCTRRNKRNGISGPWLEKKTVEGGWAGGRFNRILGGEKWTLHRHFTGHDISF